MEDDKLIKLGMGLGLEVYKDLKKRGFTPKENSMGLSLFEFTKAELESITELSVENPKEGTLVGVELLPNLKTLKVTSTGNSYFTLETNIKSISDKDIACIEKCTNLEVLSINNQAKVSSINVGNMTKLNDLLLTRNANLKAIDGLDKLCELTSIECFGNETLTQVSGLNDVIKKNALLKLNLDLLLFFDAVGYSARSGNMDEDAIKKIESMKDGVKWKESFIEKDIEINHDQMKHLYKVAREILTKYIPQFCSNEKAVMEIEKYLSEHVKYDYGAIENKGHINHSDCSFAKLTSGSYGGANGAYNALIKKTCVCEGYTRAMQYLLRLKGIKSHNVYCIANDRRHSIISIDDISYLYDDPCWNAQLCQKGDKSMHWVLLSKKEISKDHTLLLTEKNINNNHLGNRVSKKELGMNL